MSSTTINTRPPEDAKRIMRWRDLPNKIASAVYEVTDDAGDTRSVRISKNKRRVLEGLMIAPMYCASPVRISDLVHILKRDYGVDIGMDLYEDDRETDRAKFGIYTLNSKVVRVDENGGAQ